MLFYLLGNGSKMVSFIWKLFLTMIILSVGNLLYRQTLHWICQSLKSLQSRRCSPKRNTWLKTYGKISKREWYLSCQRRTLFSVLWRNYPISNAQRTRTGNPSPSCTRWNQNDYCCLLNTLREVRKFKFESWILTKYSIYFIVLLHLRCENSYKLKWERLT